MESTDPTKKSRVIQKRKHEIQEPPITTNNNNTHFYWNQFTKQLSRKSWLPTKGKCISVDSSELNSSSKRLTTNSWFSVESWRSCQFPTPAQSNHTSISWKKISESIREKATNNEPNVKPKIKKQKMKEIKKEEKEPPGKSKKIRLFPSRKQKEILIKWIGTARWTYNQCLNSIENEKTPRNKKELRSKHLNSEAFATQNQWVLETPYDVRDEGMADLLKAYQSNLAKKEKTRFKMKYRSKKSESESIVIHSKHWKSAGVFHPKSFGKEPIEAAEPLPDKLYSDSRIVKTRLGEFYLCIPLPLQVKGDNQAPKWEEDGVIEDGIISLDPGIRTFATGYTLSGYVFEWGKNDIGRVYRLCHALDKLQSKWSQKEVKHNKRHKMKRAGRRIRKKIRNLVDELHKKFVKWIVEQYHTVLLPEFETKRMAMKRANRRIGSKTARAMLGWSHYRFKQRLLDKIREYPWCKVIICDEHFTSKTCGNCGHIHQTLGSSKTFNCPRCHIEMDRDINAARNILLRYVTINRAEFVKDSALGLTPLDSF